VKRGRKHSQAGLTLMEVLIAVTLLSLLCAGMLYSLRLGLMAFTKADSKLMDNRRVSGAGRVVQEELEGMVPVIANCSAGPAPVKMPFFQGEPAAMRLVSTFSLQQSWRGRPQILELFVIPGENALGFRLVVNEIPYTGAAGAGQLCMGRVPDPLTGNSMPRFLPVVPGPRSFVLADKLAFCRFVYLSPVQDPTLPPIWAPLWAGTGWPLAIRIEMAPLEADPSRLQPMTVMAPIYIRRSPEEPYADN